MGGEESELYESWHGALLIRQLMQVSNITQIKFYFIEREFLFSILLIVEL